MAEKLFEVEYEPGKELIVRFHRPPSITLPAMPRLKVRQSVRDVLLGVRSLVDAALEVVGEEKMGRRRPSTRIEVK